MSIEEIRSSLCSYDSRNPWYDFMYGGDDDPPVRSERCYCDNCYSGKTKLALEILNLRQQLGLET